MGAITYNQDLTHRPRSPRSAGLPSPRTPSAPPHLATTQPHPVLLPVRVILVGCRAHLRPAHLSPLVAMSRFADTAARKRTGATFTPQWLAEARDNVFLFAENRAHQLRAATTVCGRVGDGRAVKGTHKASRCRRRHHTRKRRCAVAAAARPSA